MPEKRSAQTEAVLRATERLRKLDEEAAKSTAVPFMEERLSLRDVRNRHAQMTPEQRAAWVQKTIDEKGYDGLSAELKRITGA